MMLLLVRTVSSNRLHLRKAKKDAMHQTWLTIAVWAEDLDKGGSDAGLFRLDELIMNDPG